MTTFFIGLDDTDNATSRGTGHLARQIAAALAETCTVIGVTRHQLLFDPRVPMTKKNSCAAIIVEANGASPAELSAQVEQLMLADFQPGSDPGLCVVKSVPPAVAEFGRKAQTDLVSQAEARALAAEHGISLRGLGGTEDGVIGALAAVGLAAGGNDGRYVQVGRIRELTDLVSVPEILAAGIAAVRTIDGQPVTDGPVLADKLRPARRGGQPIAVVVRDGDHWLPIKLD